MREVFETYNPNANPEIGPGTNLIDILSHRTGLEDQASLYVGPNGQPLYNDTDTAIKVINHLTSDGDFRKTWAYSPLLLAMVGLLIEKASGQSLPKFLSTTLFQSLGMLSTSLVEGQKHSDPASMKYAKPYAATASGQYIERDVPTAAYGFPSNASMGIQSSVRDLAVWAKYITDAWRKVHGHSSPTDTSVISDMATILKPWCPLPPCIGGSAAYGLGMFLHDGHYIFDAMFDIVQGITPASPYVFPEMEEGAKPRKILFHSGLGSGFASSLHIFPEEEDAVIVLGNSSFCGDGVDAISKLLTSTVRGLNIDIKKLCRNLEDDALYETGRWSRLYRDLKEEQKSRPRGKVPKVIDICGTFLNQGRGIVVEIVESSLHDDAESTDLGPNLGASVRFGNISTLALPLWHFCDDTICFLPSHVDFQRWAMGYLKHWSEFLLHIHCEPGESRAIGVWWQYTHDQDAIWFERQ